MEKIKDHNGNTVYQYTIFDYGVEETPKEFKIKCSCCNRIFLSVDPLQELCRKCMQELPVADFDM